MNLVRISSRHQIAIPTEVREKLGIHPRQRFAVTVANGSIILTPLPDDPIDYLCGIFEGEPSMAAQLLEERKHESSDV